MTEKVQSLPTERRGNFPFSIFKSDNKGHSIFASFAPRVELTRVEENIVCKRNSLIFLTSLLGSTQLQKCKNDVGATSQSAASDNILQLRIVRSCRNDLLKCCPSPRNFFRTFITLKRMTKLKQPTLNANSCRFEHYLKSSTLNLKSVRIHFGFIWACQHLFCPKLTNFLHYSSFISKKNDKLDFIWNGHSHSKWRFAYESAARGDWLIAFLQLTWKAEITLHIYQSTQIQYYNAQCNRLQMRKENCKDLNKLDHW